MKTDIKNREDIEKLINFFYDKIKKNTEINYFFSDIANVNWEEHLPKMYVFFENILFSTGIYDLNPMLKHKELNEKSRIKEVHFNQWIVLFDNSVDELFVGEKADEIKRRVKNIATILMHKEVN
ncbi:MAG: group III truncated hemoglobin [Flavobacterium sp.]|uniref:group III truncated hemoglobin n=1 Tax=Flavobacterium sp. TaxID=239 RepID=UPI0026377892|nr:group III truncated hemoglobin [Flavobacterium sp.]MDD5150064.1 group III truncated hemoglobin [Flavobacterium sp.]